jgi:phosphate transport system protein
MKTHFDGELDLFKDRLLVMAAKAETMIQKSITALQDRNQEAAISIPEMEAQVNQLQVEIDDRAFKLLALRQPMAHDLRFIIAAMKISSDLERIADEAVNITEDTAVLLNSPPWHPMMDIPRMAEISGEMVRDALEAFVDSNATKARTVLSRDDQVDALKDQVIRVMLTYMISEPQKSEVALELILIARSLERIADHATNIAEDVVYLVEGKDVRHHAER